MVSNDLKSLQKINVEITVLTSQTAKSQGFTDHLLKITLNIKRESFMKLGNTEWSGFG